MSANEPEAIVPDMVISTENHRFTADGSFDPADSALAQELYENELWEQDYLEHGEERIDELNKGLETVRHLEPYRKVTGYLMKLTGVAILPVGLNVLSDNSATPKEMAVLGVGAVTTGVFGAANRWLDKRIKSKEDRAKEITNHILTNGPKFDERLKDQ